MAVLATGYIKEETLETMLSVLKKKGDKGVPITIEISDKVGNYDNNTYIFVSQTEEEKNKKKERFTISYGRAVWSNGNVLLPKKEQPKPSSQQAITDDKDDLPF